MYIKEAQNKLISQFRIRHPKLVVYIKLKIYFTVGSNHKKKKKKLLKSKKQNNSFYVAIMFSICIFDKYIA